MSDSATPANTPVIIVGAPRSGTSLMQKLIRETPGFVSVPRESDMIWLPYCHPATNDWKYEGCPDSRITEELITSIRADFRNQALSAAAWRLFDRLHLMERPRLASMIRLAYRTLYGPWTRLRERTSARESNPGRLVDKSVHAGLWLNLVDAVFPNAVYLHMVRDPQTCVPSMVDSWRNSRRFRTYQVPESIVLPRTDLPGYWCFPMPSNWEAYYHKDLVDICTFQWNAINDAIIEYLSNSSFSRPVLRVRLEDLAEAPKSTIEAILDFLQLHIPEFWSRYSALPKVNSSTRTHQLDDTMLQEIRNKTVATRAKLGVFATKDKLLG